MWRFLALSLVLIPNAADAQVPDRLLAREAVRYLELSAEQVKTLTSTNAAWLTYRATAAARAGQLDAEIKVQTRLAKPDQAALKKHHAELATICAQSQTRLQQATVASRASLQPGQLVKLAALEQAYALMPIVESAQRVNLLSSVLAGPPAGMPDGGVEVQFSYVRSAAIALPGCPASKEVVHAELEKVVPRKQ